MQKYAVALLTFKRIKLRKTKNTEHSLGAMKNKIMAKTAVVAKMINTDCNL